MQTYKLTIEDIAHRYVAPIAKINRRLHAIEEIKSQQAALSEDLTQGKITKEQYESKMTASILLIGVHKEAIDELTRISAAKLKQDDDLCRCMNGDTDNLSDIDLWQTTR